MDQIKSERARDLVILEETLKNVLYARRFCGLCFKNDGELISIGSNLKVVLNGQAFKTPLIEIIDYLFSNVSSIPADLYVCKDCTENLTQSYTFIQNTKQYVEVITSYINDFYTKVIHLQDQLDPGIYDNSKVIIVLENSEELINNPIETKIHNTGLTTQKREQPKKDSDAKNLGNQEKIENNVIKANMEEKQKKTVTFELHSKKTEMIPSREGYECVECKILWPTFKEWKQHEKKSHKDNLQCKICNKVYDSIRNLNLHYKVHNNSKCKLCHHIMEDTDLAEHLKSSHGDETHACEHCDLVYYTAPALVAHLKIKHFKSNIDENDENPQCLMCLKFFPKEKLNNHPCKYKCPDCKEIPCLHYKYLVSFKEQQLNHASKIKCVDCEYYCYRRDALIGHVNREHLNHRPYSCEVCSTQFYSKQLVKRHVAMHHQDHLDCTYCDVRFTNKIIYDNHVISCQSYKREFKCKECPASFNTGEELTSHVKLKHSTDNFPCNMCNRKFLTQDLLLRHETFSHNDVQVKQKVQSKMKCLICHNKAFDTRGEYLLHKKSHKQNVKFHCYICNTDFENLKKLQWHNRKHNDKVTCPTCSREFASLRHHNCSLTTEKEEWICETCGKTVSTRLQLKLHYRTHSRLIQCGVCNKYVIPSSMYSHKLSHKPGSQDTRTSKIITARKRRQCNKKCTYCDYYTFSLDRLEAHVNRHHLKVKPYVCSICSAAFCAKISLKLHNTVHSDEKKYLCNICDKRFRYKISLKKHIMLHTGNKQFMCDLCGKGYITIGALNEHKLKHSEKTVECPICHTMFHSLRNMRMHVKKQHWKEKDKKYNPKDIKELDEEHYHLFEDRRKVTMVET